MNRSARLQALTWSLPDLDPAPTPDPVFSGRKASERGEAPSAWQQCPSCRGIIAGAQSPCRVCANKGGWYVDAYTEEKVGTDVAQAPPRSRRVPCDRCHGSGLIPGRYIGEEGLARCPSCDGTGGLDVPFRTDDATPILDDPLNRMRSQGSYDELDTCLHRLRDLSVPGVRAYLAFAHDRQPRSFRVFAAECLLLEWMPERIRVPSSVTAAWGQRDLRRNDVGRARELRVFRSKRNPQHARIERMFLAGNDTAHIARTVGYSERSVRRICAAIPTLEAA